VLKATGRLDEAETALKQAIHLQPGYAEAHINLAKLYADGGRPGEAEAHYRQALALSPQSPDAYNNLGILMQRTGRAAEAETALRQALALAPAFAQAHNNLGNVLKESNRLDDAILAYRQAVELQPLYADAHNNLGTALKETGRYDAAQASYQRALDIAPDNADTRLNHAMFLLLRGELKRGWPEYEYRWKTTGARTPFYSQPLWHGAIDPMGKTIFLHGEQGFGDTLQFIRYAKLLAARGATVYAGVPAELKTLIATCPGVTRVFGSGEPEPSFDYHCPLMSLPLAFDTELATIPAEVPYLASEPAKSAWWRNRLGQSGGQPRGKRVGLVWAGNARRHNPSVHAVDRQRSLHVDHYASLLAIPGLKFFSLQVGEETALQARLRPAIIDLMADVRDFSDTAALIGELDLVISVDAAVAHLAGALGKPVWMLNRYNTCWRWLVDRDDSPWYPSMRIFRQPRPGDRDDVMDRVRDALVAYAPTSGNG
jgi:Flp pilus assembly protein TadD